MSIDTIGQYRINTTVELAREYCGVCGVQFALPTTLRDRCLRNHNVYFWCPNGHSLHFLGPTEAERLRDQLDQAHAFHAETRAELAEERRQHAATKGKLTKVRHRIERGICPECHRHFANVERHMASKHRSEG